jgi:hypothetical protein
MQDKCQILTTFGIFSYRGNLKKFMWLLARVESSAKSTLSNLTHGKLRKLFYSSH